MKKKWTGVHTRPEIHNNRFNSVILAWIYLEQETVRLLFIYFLIIVSRDAHA